ncbi:MAG: asparaginase [Terriglobales bacterium]
MRKQIYIAHTGGTIGMKQGALGWEPAPGYLRQQMQAETVFQHPDMPEYVIEEFHPLLDSSNITPQDWARIAQSIGTNYEQFDGFLVLHGTDTMSYTASALAFMFENLGKPVILTGSQVPLCQPRTDAYENLVTSLLIAANFDIPEVALFLNNTLLRGCRSVKTNATAFEAFASPNFPPLAIAGVDIQVNRDLVRRTVDPSGPLWVQERMDPNVGVLWLFPGITSQFVSNCLRAPIKGLVLKAFGVGNGPSEDRAFMAAIREATNRGVVVVACTQSESGKVDLSSYATGSALAAAGVIGGGDMTTEAALAKLSYLLGKGLAPSEVRALVAQDLRGELSVDQSSQAT